MSAKSSTSFEEEEVLRFVPFQSFVNTTFWHKLAEVKLDLDRLSDAPRLIHGFYTNRSTKACHLEVDYTSFASDFKAPKYFHTACGTLYNKNTIEDFKKCDKNAILLLEGAKLLDDFRNGEVIKDSKCLVRFFVLSFSDLKNHNFYYWFGFPCPMSTTSSIKYSSPKQLRHITAIQPLRTLLERNPNTKPFFIYNLKDAGKIIDLKECIQQNDLDKNFNNVDVSNYYFCFMDAGPCAEPSWPLRNFIAFIYYSCPSLVGQDVNFLGVRFDKEMSCANSLIWRIKKTEHVVLQDEKITFVGWELNPNRKMGPRMASMKNSMDAVKLAENSINMNLKLMKWRMVPDLNLEIIVNTKCLLFGAGTLGCAVSRNLLSWGFKNITLIDNGKINFSNPTRQNLYEHADAVQGNLMKAPIAADRLKAINPNVISTGHVLQVPMPGHTIGESIHEQVVEDLDRIGALVEENDVLFLLTDSRESRWLPTMLGCTFGKIVITAALGFDSYLVMRNGSGCPINADSDIVLNRDTGSVKCLNASELGCYFCNDVTAPGNSRKDRTLDQQCTVTRPGVSNIAASYAVELLVSLLQHPQRRLAPAYYNHNSNSSFEIPEGILGAVPHSIRGTLCNYQNNLLTTPKFTQCIACSEFVVTEYRTKRYEFLFKVFETRKYLEDLTGVSRFNYLNHEIIDFQNSDSDE